MHSLDSFEKAFRKKKLPRFEVGDTVDVHVKIIEGDKERVQIFSGIVLAKRHQGLSESFTVRRIVQGEGVERIFPLHSPRIVKVEVRKRGMVRRAKLHYLRERIGRSTKVQEKVGIEAVVPEDEPGQDAVPEQAAEPAPPPAKADAAPEKQEKEPAGK